MILTLQEVMDTCPDWEEFCRVKGISEWAVNEGGGEVQIKLTVEEADALGIVTLRGWKRRAAETPEGPKP